MKKGGNIILILIKNFIYSLSTVSLKIFMKNIPERSSEYNFRKLYIR